MYRQTTPTGIGNNTTKYSGSGKWSPSTTATVMPNNASATPRARTISPAALSKYQSPDRFISRAYVLQYL